MKCESAIKNKCALIGILALASLVSFFSGTYAAKQDSLTAVILPTTEIIASLNISARELSRVVVQMGLPGTKSEQLTQLKEELFEFKTKFDVGFKKYTNIQFGQEDNSARVILSKWMAWKSVLDEMASLAMSTDSKSKTNFMKLLHNDYEVKRNELFYWLSQRSDYQFEMATEFSQSVLAKCQN